MATLIGLEPTISTLTGWHVNHYTTGPRGHSRSMVVGPLATGKQARRAHASRSEGRGARRARFALRARPLR